jgi:hypothetical protein
MNYKVDFSDLEISDTIFGLKNTFKTIEIFSFLFNCLSFKIGNQRVVQVIEVNLSNIL